MRHPFRHIGIPVLVFVVSLPVLFAKELIDMVSLPRAMGGHIFLLVASIIALILLTRWKGLTMVWPTRLWSWGLVAWLGFSGLSIFQAEVQAEAWWVFSKSLFFVFWILLLIQWLQADQARRHLITLFGVVGIFLLLTACWEWWQVGSLSAESKSVYLLNASLEHKNLLASALFLLLPIYFLWISRKQTPWKVAGFIALIAALVLILFLQSRAVWIAIFLAGTWYAFTARKRLAFGGMILLGLIAIFFFRDRVQSLWQFQQAKNEHTETIRERLFLWENSMAMIQEHPVSGVGLGQWKFHFPSYGLENSRAEQGLILFSRPHNDYLWIWSETGLGGLLGWLLFLLGAIWQAYQNRKGPLALAAGAAIMGYGVVAFFDFPGERVFHLTMLGAWIALLGHQKPSPINRGVSFVILLSITIVSGCTLFFLSQRWSGESLLKEAMIHRREAQSMVVLNQIDQAKYPADPTGTPVAWYLGEGYYFQGQLDFAKEWFLQAETIHPHHLMNLNNLGGIYHKNGDQTKAILYFEKALSIAPHFNEANLNLAAIRYQKEGLKAALFQFDQCMPDPEMQRYLQFVKAVTLASAQALKVEGISLDVVGVLEKMSQNEEWLVDIHRRARQYNTTFQERLWQEAMEVSGKDVPLPNLFRTN